jgi:hypothetical protein
VNYNAHSIGIEHDNPGYLRKVDEGIYQGVCTIDTKRNPAFHVAPAPVQHNPALIMFWLAYSPSQIEASAGLHMALASAYPTIDEVRGHWEICPGRKTDTNPLFPLARMRSIVLGNRQNLPTGPERVAELAADPKAEIGVPATTIPAGYVADQAAQAALSSPQAAYSDLTAQLTTLSYQGVALAGKVVMVLGILFALYVAGKYAWQIAIGPMWRRLVPRQPDPAMLAGSDYQPVVTAYDGAYPPSPPVHRPRSLRPKRRKPSKRRRAA